MLRKSRQRILAAVNGSQASEQAFRWACQLARHTRADLCAVYVFEVPMEMPLGASQGRSNLMDGESILKTVEEIADSEHCRVNATMVEARNAGPAIALEALDKDVDLLVVGISYDRTGAPVRPGSTADYLLKNTQCQVMIARESAPGDSDGQE